ncbi:MAG: tRNA1(Val) (adenine(37)-N6)-methyltransferase [Hyphomicrobiaceae bacterium]
MSEGAASLTDDAFLGGALNILQPRQGYRAGLDAVLLAAACGARAGEGARVLDGGAGVGVAGLCVARRINDAHVTLVEREPVLAEVARQNAARNGLQERVRVLEMDIVEGGAALNRARGADAGVAAGTFSHVIANPPYYAEGRGTRPPVNLKAAAHQMAEGALEQWCRFLATAAANDGLVTVIHRAEAMAAVLEGLGRRFGALRVLPIYSRAGTAAHRIIVQGRKGSRAPLSLQQGLVLHGDGNAFVPAIDAVLRHGAALDW